MLDKLPEDLREKIIETSFYKEVIFWTPNFSDFITKLHEYIKWVEISLYLYIWTIVFILLFVKNSTSEKVKTIDKNKKKNWTIYNNLSNFNLFNFFKEKNLIIFNYLISLIFFLQKIVNEKDYTLKFLDTLKESYLKDKELLFKKKLFIDFLNSNWIDNFEKNYLIFKNVKRISKKIEKWEIVFTDINKIKDIKDINFFIELNNYENEMKKTIKEDFINSKKQINEILIKIKSDSYKKYLQTILK